MYVCMYVRMYVCMYVMMRRRTEQDCSETMILHHCRMCSLTIEYVLLLQNVFPY